MKKLVLWLFVINLGIAFGAGLYEARVEIPQWLLQTEQGLIWNSHGARVSNPGLRFWAFVTTGPLTLLTLVSLFFALVKSKGALRFWWLCALGVCLGERLFTFSYFIPTMIGLMDATSTPEVLARAILWERLNHLRHLLAFAAWMLSLKAFASFYEARRYQ